MLSVSANDDASCMRMYTCIYINKYNINMNINIDINMNMNINIDINMNINMHDGILWYGM